MAHMDPFVEIAAPSGKPKPVQDRLTQLSTNALQANPPKVAHEVLLQRQALQIQLEINHHYLAPEDAVVLSDEEDRLPSNPNGKDGFKKRKRPQSENDSI